MKPKVYITRRIPEPGISLIEQSCDVILHPHDEPPTHEEIMDHIRDKDALLCLLSDRIDREIIEAGPNLKVISTFSVGFEHIDVAAATRKGIYIGYTPGILTEATADLAFSLLLGTARRITEGDRFLRGHGWKTAFSPSLLLGTSVWGTTLGIIGLGRIGKAVARRARGFNMEVLYTKRNPLPRDEETNLGVEYRSLEELFEQSDFVSLHTPLTDETRHLVNGARLRLMKPTAVLINTARGPVVDEAALVRALQEKWIAGAGLDVFEKEPIDPTNPLLHLDNVVLLPHLGSATTQARSKMATVSARNLLAVLHGEAPPCWLNQEVEKIRPLTRTKML
ncbi:MAG: putative 2-hydroxyacid dehydrogenase [Syntrophorhabdus sp. PtaU1.Bin002]|nr:MAG: putative 2-hydroxyacid dehydrogenase [Syntrophorhabdus sp. PtaU1.Bin002]